ncbi:MAG: MFS transporter [Gemmatimonadetes bacterium]|nr:MFS transporter [Gemmatimonadota bacterium]
MSESTSSAAPAASAAPRDIPKIVWSWAFYDWANSAFTTLVVTFIYSYYFTQSIAPDGITGTAWWGRAVSISAVFVALLSPIAGAAADRGGTRKRALAMSTGVCIAGSVALTFIAPGRAHSALLALTVFVVANVAFEMSMVFYNAFLPNIASPARIGRISGYGWGLGYIGGLLCMVIALVAFAPRESQPWFGLSTANGFNVRATNLLVAGWYLVFSLPLFFNVPERRTGAEALNIREAFVELGRTFRAIRRYREVARFLIARLVYNDGLVTVFAFGSVYAGQTFGMSLSEVIAFGIGLNVASGLGALAFGFVDDKVGGKRTVLISLVALALATVLAVCAPNKTWLWVAGILIGISVGPNQSASRSLMGRFVPETHQAEFFGFFAFSGKVTSFMGPFLLGTVTLMFTSQRAGVATVLLFFLVGGGLLLLVNERAGIAAARAE